MLNKILRWAVYLLTWPLGTALVNPQWPDPCGAPSTSRNVSMSATFGWRTPAAHADAACVERTDALDTRIRQTPICIVGAKKWAGDLGKTLLFQTKRLASDRIVVGYFAYWTTERPWGDNRLTHLFLPAVAIDSVYSHLLFVLPGVQRFLYGPGDVEGLRVTYDLRKGEKLTPLSLIADDASHEEVKLDIDQAIDDSGRIVVFNDVWSHQLGGKRAVAAARAGANQQCFAGNSLRSITSEIVAEFRLGSPENPRRAGPAWGD